jgi:hypothetical protein
MMPPMMSTTITIAPTVMAAQLRLMGAFPRESRSGS